MKVNSTATGQADVGVPYRLSCSFSLLEGESGDDLALALISVRCAN